jgi:hypothetical protein
VKLDCEESTRVTIYDPLPSLRFPRYKQFIFRRYKAGSNFVASASRGRDNPVVRIYVALQENDSCERSTSAGAGRRI